MSIALAQYKGPKVAQIIDGTIAAGGNKVIEGIGEVFRLVTCDDQLMIRTNLSPKAAFTTKQGLHADESNLFDRIEIYNETANPVNFRLFFGFGDFLDGSSNILGSVAVTASALPVGAATAANQALEIAALAPLATQVTAAAILAKIIAAPSTEAKQDAANASLVSIDGKVILPAALDADGRLKIGRNALGAQANAWNAAVVGVGGTSAAVDTKDAANVSAFGNANGATTITVQVSEDNVTYYDTSSNVALGGAGDFHVSLSTGAKYVRLKSSLAATITATIAAK